MVTGTNAKLACVPFQANPGVVSCQEGQLHGLVTGDHVEFREVVGMETLNGKTFPVKGFYYTHYI